MRNATILSLFLAGGLWAMAVDTESPPPNLLVNGDFELANKPAPKEGERPAKVLGPKGWERPDGTKVDWDEGYGVDGTYGIRVQMDRRTAEGYGQGYFSDPVPVEQGEVYTVSVDVKSDAPNAIIFVKGFAHVKGEEREVFSHHKEAHFDRYLKRNEWTNLTFAFRPRHGTYPVEYVKVWLYGYLKPGTLYFDNVNLTKGGTLTPNPIPQPPRPGKRPIFVPPDPEGDSHPPVYLDPNAAHKD